MTKEEDADVAATWGDDEACFWRKASMDGSGCCWKLRLRGLPTVQSQWTRTPVGSCRQSHAGPLPLFIGGRG